MTKLFDFTLSGTTIVFGSCYCTKLVTTLDIVVLKHTTQDKNKTNPPQLATNLNNKERGQY